MMVLKLRLQMLLPFCLCALLLVLPRATQAKKGQCTESKCRGTRIHPWVEDDTELTCWIPLDWDVGNNNTITQPAPHASVTDAGYCADNYVVHLVHDVPYEMVDDELRAWYNCCEPDFDGVAEQTCKYSACSSPDWASGTNCWADGFQEPMSCGDPTFRFPHLTSQKSLIYFQFICCDTPQDKSETVELLASRILWMLLSSITVVACTILITAIMVNKKARQESWNLYLVFLAIPDAVCNIMILVRNSLTLPGVPVSPWVHIFFASIEYFYAAANLWLNGVIIGEIYYILRNSSPTKKVPPPEKNKAIQQSMIVYAFSAVVFGWAYYMYARGLIDFSLATVVNIWISTRALLVLPPLLFCLGVCFDVWNRQLLPRAGRTRVLSLYFLRVIVVFLFTWIPYFILYELSWNVFHSTWMVNISYYLASFQGTVSVLVALGKPDVMDAVKSLLCGGAADKNKVSTTSTKNKLEEGKGALRRSQLSAVRTVDSSDDVAKSEEPFSGGSDSTPAIINDWFMDDDWGNDDLDVLMKGQAGAVAARTSTEKTKALDAEEGRMQEEDDKPEYKPVENHAEWTNQFMERFHQKRLEAFEERRKAEAEDEDEGAELVEGAEKA